MDGERWDLEFPMDPELWDLHGSKILGPPGLRILEFPIPTGSQISGSPVPSPAPARPSPFSQEYLSPYLKIREFPSPLPPFPPHGHSALYSRLWEFFWGFFWIIPSLSPQNLGILASREIGMSPAGKTLELLCKSLHSHPKIPNFFPTLIFPTSPRTNPRNFRGQNRKKIGKKNPTRIEIPTKIPIPGTLRLRGDFFGGNLLNF